CLGQLGTGGRQRRERSLRGLGAGGRDRDQGAAVRGWRHPAMVPDCDPAVLWSRGTRRGDRMRAVVQRAHGASVRVDGRTVGAFDGPGLVVLLGVTHTDTSQDAERLARKIWEMRILHDEQSAASTGAPLLVVSQFTLYADLRKGRRPSWSLAAPGEVSEP